VNADVDSDVEGPVVLVVDGDWLEVVVEEFAVVLARSVMLGVELELECGTSEIAPIPAAETITIAARAVNLVLRPFSLGLILGLNQGPGSIYAIGPTS
jgi:hypothetical protein